MLKNVVIYNSKYGSTKKYAEWISQEINGDLFESSKVKISNLRNYDVIVYGGSLHAVGIKGVKLITDNFEQIKDKKIIIFSVGASPAREEAFNNVVSHNFTHEIREKISFFMLRGSFDYKNLSLIDKILMNALKFMLKKKKVDELDEDMKGLLDSFDNPVDFTDKKNIIPIIECINS